MPGITIRRIREGDLDCGFLESLDSLRRASDIGGSRAAGILRRIMSNPDHVILVALKDGRVAGSITLLMEPKFIHGGGLVGHIEDVAVAERLQGGGIGRMMVAAALEYAGRNGCYKTVLDCADEVAPFYEKAGFRRHSNSMRFDH